MRIRTELLATSLVTILAFYQPALAQRPADPAEALIKSARQAKKAEEAEDLYLRVALSHATSPYAAEALLRLGQARLAAGDAKQSAVYLQRLMADYPRSEHRPMGALWLARAQVSDGRIRNACSTLNAALGIAVDSETSALLRAEQTTVCDAADRVPVVSETKRDTPATRESVPAPPLTRPAPAPATTDPRHRYTIQVAAFREHAGARSVARELSKAGFTDVRLVTVPGNALVRVRIGRYENSAGAAAMVSRLKMAGYSVVVVSDALSENPVQ